MHPVLAEVIGGDAGDDGDVGARDRESASQDAAACRLEDRGLGVCVAQHAPRPGRAGIVAGAERSACDENAVGAAVTGRESSGLGAGREQSHDGGLAVGAGDERRWNGAKRGPVDGRWHRQIGERPAVAARAGAERESLVIEQVRQAMRLRRFDERAQSRIRLARSTAPKAQQRAGGFEDRRFHLLRLFGGQGIDERRHARGFALGDRGRERPLVDFGGGEELVGRRRKRERGARLVRHGAGGGRGPAQLRAGAQDALAPGNQHRRVVHPGLEHGTAAVKEPVVAGQAARFVPGRCAGATQSDASGA